MNFKRNLLWINIIDKLNDLTMISAEVEVGWFEYYGISNEIKISCIDTMFEKVKISI